MVYILSIHLIAVICWFAGLFYLPRLFVYHAMTKSAEVADQLKIMEHKLYFYIMMPAMMASILSGLYLLVFNVLDKGSPLGWMWAKLFLVFLLIIFQGYCGYFLLEFKQDRSHYSHRFYRYFNEIPTILLILIIFLAIVRPF